MVPITILAFYLASLSLTMYPSNIHLGTFDIIGLLIVSIGVLGINLFPEKI
mgnify:CR=1 FL=1